MTKNDESESVRDYKSALKDAALEAAKVDLTKQYGKLAAEIQGIPEGVRAQMTLLIEARQLHAVRRIKEIEGISPQEFIRQAVSDAIARKLTAPTSARARKRA